MLNHSMKTMLKKINFYAEVFFCLVMFFGCQGENSKTWKLYFIYKENNFAWKLALWSEKIQALKEKMQCSTKVITKSFIGLHLLHKYIFEKQLLLIEVSLTCSSSVQHHCNLHQWNENSVGFKSQNKTNR